MRIIMTAGLSVLFASAALAAGPKTMDAIDITIDGRDLKGQTVTVTGCRFIGSNTRYVTCRSTANTSVSFNIDGKTLEREQLRRLIKKCPHMQKNPACEGSITGKVDLNTSGDVMLRKAKIKWSE